MQSSQKSNNVPIFLPWNGFSLYKFIGADEMITQQQQKKTNKLIVVMLKEM